MEYASGKGGAIQMEGGRREIDLLFPFGGFDVDDVLDCQGTSGGGGKGTHSCRLFFPSAYCVL